MRFSLHSVFDRFVCGGTTGLRLAICRRGNGAVVGQAAATRVMRIHRRLRVLHAGAPEPVAGLFGVPVHRSIAAWPGACRLWQNEERLAFLGYRVQVIQGAGTFLCRCDRRAVGRALQLSSRIYRPWQHRVRPVDDGGALLSVRRHGDAGRTGDRNGRARNVELRPVRRGRHPPVLADHPRTGAARRGDVPAHRTAGPRGIGP